MSGCISISLLARFAPGFFWLILLQTPDRTEARKTGRVEASERQSLRGGDLRANHNGRDNMVPTAIFWIAFLGIILIEVVL